MTPLRGVRVIDLSRYLPGPYLTRILADLGAEVIKIESPKGDALRFVPPQVDGMGAAFAAVNAGKQSVAIDLKKPEGVALLKEMLAGADVLVESFRPGVMDRLGLPVAQLCEEHPRLIACSLTGYGQTGSMRDVAGHDINYLARAGILGLMGPKDAPPTVPGVQIADVAGGSLPGAIAVLAALLERQQTGRGRHLDISMCRGATALGVIALANAAGGHTEPRGQGMLTGGFPCYRSYQTADGQVSIGALEPNFFGTLCQVAGRPDLMAKGWDTSPEAHAALEDLLRTKTTAEWVALLDGHDACLEPVRDLHEVLADDELAPVFAHPELGAPIAEAGAAPAVGAHNASAPAALGVSEATLQAALDAGAISN